MNKTTKIILIVVVLLLLGGGAYYLVAQSHKQASQTAEIAPAQNQTQMTSGKKSLFDFFSMAGSVKCTFSDKTDNSSGTVYVSGGKMRGDFQSTTTSHMINDGSFVYMWTDGQKAGYKMSLDFVKKESTPVNTASGNMSEQSSSQPVNMRQQADYSCGPWSADTSVFTLPQGVTFTDYSAMMQAAMKRVTPQEGMTSKQQQTACQQCDQVPAGAMRNQCRAALKCQ